MEEKYNVSTVTKAFAILDLLGKHEFLASEIASELAINKATVHRLLYTMESARYIERNPETKKYRVGIKLVELCSLRINDIEVKIEARPFLTNLVDRIRQPVHLGIYSGGQVIFIDKIDVLSSIRIYSAIGKTIPIHCSAIGKALVLDYSDQDIIHLMTEKGMERFTQNTLTTPTALLEELHAARITGYTYDEGEHEENVCCLAVPVYDYRKQIIAAISTASHRSSLVNQAELIRLLKQTAQDISANLGFTK